ncbi:hypothetical protein L9F63_012359, partial [Diploptera punctata]
QLEFREDLKKVLKEAGGRGRSTVLLISEAQIKYEIFLMDVESLLNSGEVPNLFAKEEMQEIIE